MKRLVAMIALLLLFGGAGLGVAQTAQSISAKDKAVGAKTNPELLAEYGGLYAGPQAEYVTRVGRRIAVQSGLSDAQGDFTIALLNSPVNNAFAIPGGYVYVTRQLVALMNDEAELAGVLGHEVGHVAARHSAKRQRAATVASGIGLLGQIASGLLLGNSALGDLATQGIGQGAQLVTLRYSRKQETEADDLGVRYLAGAGYDPAALARSLAALQAQTNLDAQTQGRDAGGTPAWASTHPDPGARVARASAQAAQTGRTGGARERDAFLAALDGALYDDDPQQGVADGRSFRHPLLKVGFTAPQGYVVAGGKPVSISGNGGQAQFGGKLWPGGLDAYVASVFETLGASSPVGVDRVRRVRLAGGEAAFVTVRATTQSGQVDATVVGFEAAPGMACHFLLLTPAGSGVGPFRPMLDSFRRLTDAEAKAIRPRRIEVVTVGKGDTIASLAGRMAYADYRERRFRTLNALESGETPAAGRKVKLVVYG